MNLPGLYPAAVASIERMDAELAALRRQVGAMARGDDERFPALLTDSDDGYDPVRVLWAEQDFDANGLRTTKVGGRSGTATNMPAFAVGGGTLPATGAWPADGVEVELRRRRVADDADDPGETLGPVYEFDWPGIGGGGGAYMGGGIYTSNIALSTSWDALLPTNTVSLAVGTYMVHARAGASFTNAGGSFAAHEVYLNGAIHFTSGTYTFDGMGTDIVTGAGYYSFLVGGIKGTTYNNNDNGGYAAGGATGFLTVTSAAVLELLGRASPLTNVTGNWLAKMCGLVVMKLS